MPRFLISPFVVAGVLLSSMLLNVSGQVPNDFPKLVYSTFLDGAGGELIRDIAEDAEGNIYVTGGTYSADFPTTPEAYQTTLNPGTTPPGTNDGSFADMDVFVTKFDPSGTIVWSTLLGGPQYDRAYAIELDAEGNVYVGGRAGPAFPVTPGAIQEDFIFDTVRASNGYGDQDAFVAKLSADGSSLLWATYLGSASASLMRDFRVDPVNGVVHCGVNNIASSFAHLTPDALQTNIVDSIDAAYVKLDADDGSLIYGTMLSGSGSDYRPSLVNDGAGGVYFMLQSDSQDLPIPPVGFEQGPNGGMDFVVYHFDMNNNVISATHFGGSGDEVSETHSIALDSAGNVFLGGGTSSSDLPARNTGAQPAKANLNDGFVAKLTGDLATVLASTYQGGSDGDGGEGVHIAHDNTVYIAGPTKSSDLPTTSNALIPDSPGGGRNGIFVRFSNDLSTRLYSSYIGGSDEDDARIAYVSNSGDIYLGGIARSDDFPVLNALDPIQSGAYSAFLMKFELEDNPDPDNQAPIAVASALDTIVDVGQPVTLDGLGSSDADGTISGYAWTVGNYVLGNNASEVVMMPAGSYEVTLTVTDDDGASATDIISVGVRDPNASDPDLLAWWRFDEATGMQAADSSGNGHHGSLENLSGDEWESGRIGGSLRIENGNERVVVPHADSLNLGENYSITAWIKLNRVPFYGRIAVKGGETDGWGMVVPNAPGLNWVYAGTGYASPGNVLGTGKWELIAVTYDGSTLRYYVDGELVDTKAVTLSALPNEESIYIGNYPTLARPLDGAIDELRIYKRVLSPLEIAGMATETGIDTDADRLTNEIDPDDDNDRLTDSFESAYGFDSLVPDNTHSDQDKDSFSLLMEHAFDTSPNDPTSWPRPPSITRSGGDVAMIISSSANRKYTLQHSPSPGSELWQDVPGQIDIPGNNGDLTLTGKLENESLRFFRVQATPGNL